MNKTGDPRGEKSLVIYIYLMTPLTSLGQMLRKGGVCKAKETDRHTDRHTYRHTHTDRQTDK